MRSIGNNVEKKLKALFDFQLFEQNKRLAATIAKAEASFAEQLSDDDLGYVCAAGEIDISLIDKSEKNRNGND